MAYVDKQGFWVLKVMIEGQTYTERTELRGESQKVEREAKRRQDDFKRRKKDELARGQASMKRGENGDILDHGLAAAFAKYFDQQGQYANGHASKDIDRDLTWVAASLGPTTLLSDLSTRKLLELREKRRVMPKYGKEGYPRISGRTCNATFERLKFCLNWLRETGYTVPEIAWKRVWVEEDPRETSFTVETARLLVRTMRRDYLDCLIFALLGGPRRAQCVGLKWADIDWDLMIIKLIRQKKRGAKKKKAKAETRIPITPWMRELILRQIDPETGQPYHSTYVWTFVAERTVINRKAGDGFYEEGERYPITYSGLGTFWHRWKEANGVTNCRLHDLRHAAGTLLEDTASDLGLAQQMLGHSNRATTEGYVHQSVDRLKLAMTATHEALRAKLEGREPDLRGEEDEADAAFGDEAEEAVASQV